MQWPPNIRSPEFIANLTFSMYSIILFLCLLLLVIRPESSDWLGALPGFGGLIIFCANYFILIRTGRLKIDKIEFDGLDNKTRNKRRIIFILLILLSVFIFIFEAKFIKSRTDKSFYLNSKKIKIGAISQDIIQTMGHYHQAMMSPENPTDSLYYYEFYYNGFSGVEFNFDKNTKRIKRINYLE
jgi:hypothetical protein